MLKTCLLFLAVTFFLAACASGAPLSAPAQTAASPDPTAVPASPSPTATEIQLPFDDTNVESEYCKSPEVSLSLSSAQGLSDNAIAARLMEAWLAYFNAPQAPAYCRIQGYHIDKVYYDARTPNLPLEPKGDFMRVVQFSIQLIQIPNFWMSWGGNIDHQNWLHTANNLAIFHGKTAYTMRFAYP